jgi:hypothetical protein
MPTQHPVNFEEKVRLPKGGNNGDYPYAIKAQDLMKNFVYAAIDLPEGVTEEFSGEGGYRQRRLKPPASGTWVLGAKDGVVQWLETEACE